MNNMLYTIYIFSENIAGVLNQVTNVFTRRQLNIESIDAGPSGLDDVHRYTITCRTDESTIDIVCRQIEKKIDVLIARYYTPDQQYSFNMAFADLTAYLAHRNEMAKRVRYHENEEKTIRTCPAEHSPSLKHNA